MQEFQRFLRGRGGGGGSGFGGGGSGSSYSSGSTASTSSSSTSTSGSSGRYRNNGTYRNNQSGNNFVSSRVQYADSYSGPASSSFGKRVGYRSGFRPFFGRYGYYNHNHNLTYYDDDGGYGNDNGGATGVILFFVVLLLILCGIAGCCIYHKRCKKRNTFNETSDGYNNNNNTPTEKISTPDIATSVPHEIECAPPTTEQPSYSSNAPQGATLAYKPQGEVVTNASSNNPYNSTNNHYTNSSIGTGQDIPTTFVPDENPSVYVPGQQTKSTSPTETFRCY